MIMDLGKPFLPNVLERGRGGYAEAYEKDVGLGVGERSQAIIVLLPRRIEESQCIGFVANPGGELVSLSSLLRH
jgi:hypothetical protein